MKARFCLVPLALLLGLPGIAHGEPPGISPAAPAPAVTAGAADRDAARWAELEAQARITDGDYDGAVQAEKQADAARSKATQQELAARAARRP